MGFLLVFVFVASLAYVVFAFVHVVTGGTVRGAFMLPAVVAGLYVPRNIPEGWEIFVFEKQTGSAFRYSWHVRRIGASEGDWFERGYADTRRGAIFAADERFAKPGPWRPLKSPYREIIRNPSDSML